MYGAVLDKDTSADPVTQVISTHNSIDKGSPVNFPILAHAIRATFDDETDSYAQDEVYAFRDGFDINTAVIYETVDYPGFTAAAKVLARAQFDINQLVYRNSTYTRGIGQEGVDIQGGNLVGLNDDVLEGSQCAGYIKSVTSVGGFITQITLDEIMPWSAATDISQMDDMLSMSDMLNPTQQMAVAIRTPDNTITIRAITEIVDGNTCTFAVAPADDGSIVPDLLVIAGTLHNVMRRCKVLAINPTSSDTFDVTLVDEAPNLFVF